MGEREKQAMQRNGRRAMAALAATTLLATACSTSGNGSRTARSATGSGPVLRIATTDGMTGVRANSGEIAYRTGPVSPAPNGRILYRTEPVGPDTRVVGLDGDAGQVRSQHLVSGSMEVRAVGTDGRYVVLAPARPPGSDRYGPLPKDHSSVAVLDTDDGVVRSVEFAGNYEPEALSSDGAALFVVEFTPPMEPDRYRVRRLDLVTRTVGDIFSPDKELQQDMRGSACRQVMAGDGRRLYTLYNVLDADANRRAFVHVLDLQHQWAHCVDLPEPLGTSPEDALALALDPGGQRLFVLDRGLGKVAEVDTTELRVARTTAMPSAIPAVGSLLAATEHGRLYAATGRTVVAFDPESGDALRRFDLPMGATVVDLVTGGDAGVYVSSGDALWRAGSSGSAAPQRVPLPEGTLAVPPARDAGIRSSFQCAC